MDTPLVLLTGATGFVGIRVLAMALENGYRVRCAVRSQAGMDKIRAAASIQNLAPTQEQLSSVVVPDITIPGAYDQAVTGVQYIIHCASPIHDNPEDSKKTDDEAFIQPAVLGTVGMLESAAACGKPTLKKVVLTSSIIAVIPHEYFLGQGDASRLPFSPNSRIPNIVGPYTSQFHKYQASKIASLNAVEVWQEKHEPQFDVIKIMPALIGGHDGLASTLEQFEKGGNAVLAAILKGNKAPFAMAGSFVDVEDVSLAHVRALNSNVTGDKSFIVGESGKWDEIAKIAELQFPEAFQDGIMKRGGEQPTIEIGLDASESQRVLGIEPTPFEKCVATVARQLIHLSQRR